MFLFKGNLFYLFPFSLNPSDMIIIVMIKIIMIWWQLCFFYSLWLWGSQANGIAHIHLGHVQTSRPILSKQLHLSLSFHKDLSNSLLSRFWKIEVRIKERGKVQISLLQTWENSFSCKGMLIILLHRCVKYCEAEFFQPFFLFWSY